MFHKTPRRRVLFSHCRRQVGLLVFGVILILVAIPLLFAQSAQAATNNTLNFQARLHTAGGAVVPDGYYNVEFKLYSASSGGSALWTETWYDTNGATAGNDFRVKVRNGYLTANLGSVTSFPSTINWDQDLWLTMNIGGTSQTSPDYDGEMNPRLKLTGIPYAFKAGQLAKFNSTTGYTSTLQLQDATGGNQNFIIPDQGAAGTYNLLTTAAAAGAYIQNSTSVQTANLSIQSSSASDIAANIVGAASQTAFILRVGASGVSTPLLSVGSTGDVLLQGTADSATAFNIKNSGNLNVFTVDTVNSRVGINLSGDRLPTLDHNGLEIDGAIRLNAADGGQDAFVTPVGSVVGTAINIPAYEMNDFSQVIALGTLSNSADTARVLSLFDARTSAHQPTLSVFDPTENNVFGLSWDGSNTTGYLKNTANIVAIQGNGLNIGTFSNASGTAVLTLGTNGVLETTKVDTQSAGTLSIGTDVANAITLGRSSVTTTNAGSFTSSELLTAASGLTVSSGNVDASASSGSFSTSTGAVSLNGNTSVAAGKSFTANGTALFKNSVDSGAAFSVQNAAGTSLINVDTTTDSANLITNSSFETNATGWSARSGTTNMQRTTTSGQHYLGNAGLSYDSTEIGHGVNYPIQLSPSTAYTFQVYVRPNAGGTTPGIKIGYAADGSDETTYLSPASPYNSASWSRVKYEFTTPASVASNAYLFVTSVASTDRTFYLDSAALTAAGGAYTPMYAEGKIQFSGILTTPMFLRNEVDSNTAFELQTASGARVLNVDSGNSTVTVGNIVQTTSKLFVSATSTAGLTVSQTGAFDILKLTDGSGAGTTVFTVADEGAITARTQTDTATAFQVQNSSGNAVMSVDTSGNQLALGKASTISGKLLFQNSTNANTVAIQSGATSTGYTLTLPTALGSAGDCLKDTNGSGVLGFVACGGAAGVSTVGSFSGSSQTNGASISGTTITFGPADATNPGMVSTGTQTLAGNKTFTGATTVKNDNSAAFSVQNTSNVAIFGVDTTTGAATLQDTAGNTAIVLDGSNSHLKVYANTTTPTLYADIYYDSVNSEAVFAASSGTTRIGNGTGNITLELANVGDVIVASKTATLAGAYSNNDFSITQTLTGGSNAVSGSVLNVSSLTTTSGTNSQDILRLSQNSGTATGNLIVASAGGTDKFKVSNAGLATLTKALVKPASDATDVFQVQNSSAAVQFLINTTSGEYSFGGATASGSRLSVKTSGSQNILSLQDSSATGVFTVGSTGDVLAKASSSSSSAFQVQNTSSAALITADSTNNRIQIGSSTSDGTAVLLIADSYNGSSDPTGVNGAMYYNSDMRTMRCYYNGLWSDCSGGSMRNSWLLQEDFASGSVASNNTGTHGWAVNAAGTGPAIAKVNTSTASEDQDLYGVISLSSGTTAASGETISLGQNNISGTPTNLTVEANVATVTDNSSATLRIGLHNSTSGTAPVNGIYFQFDTATDATNWYRCTANNNTRTCTSTGIAKAAAGTYQRLKFVTNSTGNQVDFYINEVSAGSNTTNLPAAGAPSSPAIAAHSPGTSAKTFKFDYFQMRRNLTTLR